ncbi:MAG TPA: DNA-processing protein DprA [Caulobacteraceae bacterium]|nr:DNA-processing protein DprA [Caulobacteraceae bacterium]
MTADAFPFAERFASLRLARTESVGPVAFQHLIRRYGSALRALEALPDLARRAGRAPAIYSPEQAYAELTQGELMGAELLCAAEPAFPEALKAIDPPPPVIWALGDAALLQRRAVAIVGARVASAAGCRFARGLASELGAAGLAIASGLARGVDAAAHEGSLATGTVAVLGGGIGDVYPPENAALYRQIAERGCIVSESAPLRRAQAKDFPRRNRLISGLSLAVVVVEAELKSGSLITARLAAEQGREVLAVPGSPLDPRARGCNDLIRQGAAVCEGAEDVLRAIEPIRGFSAPPPPDYASTPDATPPELLERVFDLTSPTPVHIDELARLVGAPAGAVFAALVELSLAGRVELAPGGVALRT